MKIFIASSDLDYNFIQETLEITLQKKFNGKNDFILHNIKTNSFVIYNIRSFLSVKYPNNNIKIISSDTINKKIVEKPDACIFLYDGYDNIIPKYIEKFNRNNCNLLQNTIIYRCIKRKDAKLVAYRIYKLTDDLPEVSFEPERNESKSRYDYSRSRLKDLGLLEEK